MLLKFEKNKIMKIEFNENELDKLKKFFMDKLKCEEYTTTNFLAMGEEARVYRYTNGSIQLRDNEEFIDYLKDNLCKKFKNEGFRSYISFIDDINRELYKIDFGNKNIIVNLAILRLRENKVLEFNYFISDIVIYIIYIMFKSLFNFVELSEKEITFKLNFNGETK